MSATAAVASVLRFTPAVRPAAVLRLATGTRPASFTFRTARRTPQPSLRFSRPISSSAISLLPHHTATSSALINSKLSVSSCAYVWPLDDG